MIFFAEPGCKHTRGQAGVNGDAGRNTPDPGRCRAEGLLRGGYPRVPGDQRRAEGAEGSGMGWNLHLGPGGFRQQGAEEGKVLGYTPCEHHKLPQRAVLQQSLGHGDQRRPAQVG